MKLVIVLSLVTVVISAEDAGDRPNKWFLYDGSFYHIGAGQARWSDARAACRKMHPKADLPAVHSYGEHTFLKETFGNYIWIGMSDIATEGQYVWANGATVDYTKWVDRSPYPDDHCAYLQDPTSGDWGTDRCTAQKSYVCKVEL